MHVSELYDLTHWVTKEIVSTEIQKKYLALQKLLQQSAQPNQPKLSFENQKNSLLETLKNAPLQELTRSQLLFLKELGIAQAVGIEGVRIIEDILFRNVIDVATSAQKLDEIIQKFSAGTEKLNQIEKCLQSCVPEEKDKADKDVLIRVSFTGNATMSNVVDFKNSGTAWHEIGRGIAMAHNATPEDVKIVGTTKGSIILELGTTLPIVTTICTIVFLALKLADRVLTIRKKAEEIQNLKLSNKKLSEDIKKAAEAEKTAGITNILTEIVKPLKLKENEGDKQTALRKAIENLVAFTESDGEVDFIIPKEKDDGKEIENNAPRYEELRTISQEIRQLETRIKRLEFKDFESKDT